MREELGKDSCKRCHLFLSYLLYNCIISYSLGAYIGWMPQRRPIKEWNIGALGNREHSTLYYTLHLFSVVCYSSSSQTIRSENLQEAQRLDHYEAEYVRVGALIAPRLHHNWADKGRTQGESS